MSQFAVTVHLVNILNMAAEWANFDRKERVSSTGMNQQKNYFLGGITDSRMIIAGGKLALGINGLISN